MAKRGPGKSHREGISIIELGDMFPTEEAAVKWFERAVWGSERCCSRCGSLDTHEVPNAKPMPYRCRDCKKYFSVRTGTVMERSKVPVRKWVYAIYLDVTSLKGVASMKIYRDLKVTQKTAWFMQQRIREAFQTTGPAFSDPVEIDESYFGGLERNKHESKRQHAGRGAVGKTAVVGAKDRASGRVAARVVDATDKPTLQGFVKDHAAKGAKVYTDEHGAYDGLSNREKVKHSVAEYVREQAHTNGIESFWSMLKRAHKGTFHKLSAKHIQRYVDELAARHNIRNMNTMRQMEHVVALMVGKRLMYRDLIA
ncbi:MAG: IS1595 family transposase [Gemmatimonadota bacterium]|nr:IS1595 family transposase [Gemmatimonadota bacterium]